MPSPADPPRAGAKALEIRNLSKSFGTFKALRDIDLEVEAGEFLWFLGPSGCGKTTLLRAIAGLDRQDGGSIFQNGRDISALPVAARDFGIVFQSYALFPNLTAGDNIGYGLARLGRAERRRRVQELVDLVGLGDQAHKYPAALSGGQQQRVALARALAPSPGLLLLDEPLSALDAQVRLYLRDQLRDLQTRLGVTTIMVTHDQEEAIAVADRIVVMNRGAIEQVGRPEEIYARPATRFVAEFLGDTNVLEAVVLPEGSLRVGQASLAAGGSAAFRSGDRVVLCIRPSDLVLSPSGAGGIEATVHAAEFRGGRFRATVFADSLETALRAKISRAERDALQLAPGSRVSLSFPQDSAVVFPAA
jgi:iron(III) transport system ATP-binding protein